MEFIGRENEVAAIENMLSKPTYQGCLIYGRRRMGKTELIKHCFKNKKVPIILYQCKESNEKDNVNQLTKLIKEVIDIDYLSFDFFMDAINFIFEYAKDHEIYFALDEYPYIRNFIDGCDSKLQKIIDDHVMTSNIKFFILGSSISVMEEIQSHDNPLYMRFTSYILLKQMDYYDSSLFYPTFSLEDKVKLYAVFGGVPYYNAQIDELLSVKENIIRLISGQFSSFKDYLTIHLKVNLEK